MTQAYANSDQNKNNRINIHKRNRYHQILDPFSEQRWLMSRYFMEITQSYLAYPRNCLSISIFTYFLNFESFCKPYHRSKFIYGFGSIALYSKICQKSRITQKIFQLQTQVGRKKNILSRSATHHPTHETLPAPLAGDMCVQMYSHTQTSAAYNCLSLI